MFANSLWVVFFQKMKYNDRINESLTEVYIMSNKIVEELVAEIRQDLAILYKAAEAVALLDMLVAFAHTSSTQDYSIFFFSFHSKLFLFSFFFSPPARPEFTQTLCIRQGRHPIQEIISLEEFVPNDTFCNLGCSFQVITGPNMVRRENNES